MAGELSDITDQRRRARRTSPEDTTGLVADQLAILRRAITTRALPPDLSFELRRNSEGAWLVVVDTRTNTETLLAGPADWKEVGTYGR